MHEEFVAQLQKRSLDSLGGPESSLTGENTSDASAKVTTLRFMPPKQYCFIRGSNPRATTAFDRG